MTKITADRVRLGEEFATAGRWYVRAQEAELARHPSGDLPGTIAAYSLGNTKDRVPVSVRNDCHVYVARKDG